MKKELNNSEKEAFLIVNGWNKEVGYLLEGRGSDDFEQWFISEQEFNEAYKNGSKNYFYIDGDERMHDLEDAWENLLDDFECECKEDYDYADVEQHIYENHIKGADKKGADKP